MEARFPILFLAGPMGCLVTVCDHGHSRKYR